MVIEFPTVRELMSRASVYRKIENAAAASSRVFDLGEHRGRVFHAEELNVYVVTHRPNVLRRTFPGLTLTEVKSVTRIEDAR